MAPSPTRTSASSCCSPAWPRSRSRTPASTRTRPSRPSRRGAPPRRASRSTGAAAAVLHEHDLMEALRLVAREAVRLLEVRLVAVAVPDEFAGRRSATRSPRARPRRPSTPPPSRSRDSFAGSVLLAGVADSRRRPRRRARSASFVSAKRLAGHDVIAQPVVVGEEPAAVLLAADREDGARARGDDQELLEVLATFAAIAVHTSRSLARERARAEALARLRQTQTDAEARRETLARVIETQERERRRLAQDLHDRTAGGLTSVLFALRRLERELGDDGAARAAERGARGRLGGDRGRARPDRGPAPEGARRLRPRPCPRAPLLDDRPPQRPRRAAGAGRGPRRRWRPRSRPPSTASCRRRSATSCATPRRATWA